MPEIRAERAATIPAPPSLVYDLLTDYRAGHPRILPPRYFREFRVESGGRGTGTRIAFQMTVFGRTRRFRMLVSEPEPGRRLVETDEASGIATSFVVDPGTRSSTTRVTISTRYAKHGVSGWLEWLLSPTFLRMVYASELRLLEDAVAGPGAPPAPRDPATLSG